MSPRPARAQVAALALCSGLALAVPVVAHELAEDRATLTLREQTHLSLVLYVDYPRAIRRALAPTADDAGFVLSLAALDPAEFERRLRRAHDRLQAAVRLAPQGGAAPPPLRWNWPDARRAQALFRQQAMAMTVGDHRHAEPLEIRAEARTATPVTALDVRFGQALAPMTLVWYRPRQARIEPERDTTVRFD